MKYDPKKYALKPTQLTKIGRKAGLRSTRLKLYVGFMKERLPNEASPDCAGEWAGRFRRGSQYTYGDLQSRRAMLKVAKKLNYPRKFVIVRSGATPCNYNPNWEKIKKVEYVKGCYKHFR